MDENTGEKLSREIREDVRSVLLSAGAVAVGFSEAGDISMGVAEDYERWIGEGCHGEMGYLERHVPLRLNTDHVLPGARTVISLAYSFRPKEWRDESLPYISAYAYGPDYHVVLREIFNPVIARLKEELGGKWRLCIDSAPVAERYWALKSGIGKRGLNCAVIVDGCGPLCFLAEILTTIEIPPDRGVTEETDASDLVAGWCSRCGRCLEVCPTGALRGDGTMDARRCINYLMIEKKSPLTESEQKIVDSPPGHLLGCDRCLKVCRMGFATEKPCLCF